MLHHDPESDQEKFPLEVLLNRRGSPAFCCYIVSAVSVYHNPKVSLFKIWWTPERSPPFVLPPFRTWRQGIELLAWMASVMCAAASALMSSAASVQFLNVLMPKARVVPGRYRPASYNQQLAQVIQSHADGYVLLGILPELWHDQTGGVFLTRAAAGGEQYTPGISGCVKLSCT